MIHNLIFEKLNTVYQFNSGGCCYVAYLIAKELERLNEPFKLVIQASSYKGNHYCICSDRFGFLNSFSECDNTVRFSASADTILKIYEENDWSQRYDTRNNKSLEDEIRHLFSIY